MSKKIEITCSGSKSLPIDDLKDFQGNLKTLPKTELEKLKRSIVNHGFSFPVFVWRKNILDGHQRLFATKELLKEGCTIDDIPVVDIQAKNKKHAAQKLLLLNSRYADFTEDGISAFIKEFEFELPDIEDISLPDLEIEDFLGNDENEGLTDPDEIPEPPEEPITKTGDLWILGNHRLLCGDSTNEADVKRIMNGELADVVFTDPPYSLTGGGCKGKFVSSGFMSGDKFIDKSKKKLFDVPEFEEWIKYLKLILNIDSEIFIFSNNRNLKEILKILEKYNARMHNILIMYKNTGFPHIWYTPKHEFILYFYFGKAIEPKNKMQSSVFETKMIEYKYKQHPTEKSVELISKILKNHNHKLIYEPFCGSGSTLIAAEKTNRKCYGIEIDPKYCDVIVKRWEDYTGKKAQIE